MKSRKREDRSMKWQKIAAFLLVIALLLPLLVTVAGPLSSDGTYLNPDSQEFWSSVEFYENDSLRTMDETSFDSIAVNWGSRIVPLNVSSSS
jgi:hypothetical protein